MSGPHPRGGGAPTRVRGATPLPSRLRRGRRRQAPHGDPQHRLGFLGRRGAVRGRRRAERRALGLALFRPGGRVAEFLADPSVLRDGRPVLAGGARGTAAGAAPAPARRAGPGLRSRPAGRRGGPGAPGAPSGRGSGLLAGGGAGARRPRALGGDGPAPDRLGRGLAAGGGQSGGSPVASGGSGGAQRSTQATPSSARGGGRKKAVSPLGRKSAATSRPAEATARGAK